MKQFLKSAGFTFLELMCVLLILGITIPLIFFAVTTVISSANHTRVQSDFRDLESECTQMLLENPGLLKSSGRQPKKLLQYFNASETTLALDFSHCGTDENLQRGNSNIKSLKDIKQSSILAIKAEDPWGVPYRLYIQADKLKVANTAESDLELRIFLVSNGENRTGSDKPNFLDVDDICFLIECINGKIRTGYYDAKNNCNEILWYAKDSGDSQLNVDDKDTILNMNYACLPPLEDYETHN